MDKLVWLVSPSNFNVDVFIKKVSFLSACLNKDLVLAVDYNDRFTHRDYWSRLVGFIHHEQKVSKLFISVTNYFQSVVILGKVTCFRTRYLKMSLRYY